MTDPLFKPTWQQFFGLVLLCFVGGLLFVVFPSLDRQVSGFFADGTNGFPYAQIVALKVLREVGAAAPFVLAALTVLILVMRRGNRLFLQALDIRLLIAGCMALAIGSGLVVNLGFKTHWERPRPVHLQEFGGHADYRDWWDPSGSCERNCSFASGEASSAATVMIFALALPVAWRLRGFLSAFAFTLIVSGLRIVFGGHFLSDVVFGILLTLLVGLASLVVLDFLGRRRLMTG